MSTARLPHTRSGNDSQTRRRYNELSDQVSQTVGSIASGSGDIGALQSQLNTTANGDGSFSRTASDGTIEQWGTFTIAPTGTFHGSGAWTFHLPYKSAPNIQLTLVGYAAATNPDPNACYAVSLTATGFTAVVSCAVPTGGGGSTITNTVTISWRSIGS